LHLKSGNHLKGIVASADFSPVEQSEQGIAEENDDHWIIS
jgi:hypothetical protein